MNNQLLNEGLLSEQMLQLTDWLGWMQPFLYCLLAFVVVTLMITLLDMAMLWRKEFHATRTQETTKTHAKIVPIRKATITPILRNQL